MTAPAHDPLAALEALHRDAGESQGYPLVGGYTVLPHACGTCGTYGEYGVEWPCATAKAIAEARVALGAVTVREEWGASFSASMPIGVLGDDEDYTREEVASLLTAGGVTPTLYRRAITTTRHKTDWETA